MEDDTGFDSFFSEKTKTNSDSSSSSSSHNEKNSKNHPHYLGVSEGAQAMLSFDGFMNFTVGILAGSSLTTNSSQLDTCRNSIHTEWYFGY